ncbi:MAG: AAA family ATPase [Candidatus Aminicenantes bacterium]|nr:AAA family ATPase [Candidatus Aminicenantes bacterium]
MKIAITGKGGTGKTTLAGILAQLFSQDGYRVLAVDADPDANLASALGIPDKLAGAIKPISEQRQLIKERTGANPRQFGQLFKINPTVTDIPDDYSLNFHSIKLLVMGAVRRGGDGCACPENVLLKNLLSEIILHRNEVVIVDMEAGIEHLGRATSGAIDKMLIVVEPGSRSITTARTIVKLGDDIGLHDFSIVGNKIRSDRQREWIRKQCEPLPVLGMIPYSDAIQDSDLHGKPPIDVIDPNVRGEFDRIYQQLLHGSS